MHVLMFFTNCFPEILQRIMYNIPENCVQKYVFRKGDTFPVLKNSNLSVPQTNSVGSHQSSCPTLLGSSVSLLSNELNINKELVTTAQPFTYSNNSVILCV